MAVEARLVAEAALRREVRSATITDREPVAYDPFLAGRSVERIGGLGTTAAGTSLAWSAIVKRTSGPGLRAGRRELAAYQHGIAAATSPGSMSAPALLAVDQGESHVEVWLEELRDDYHGRWPNTRYGIAARHIATWDADTHRRPPVTGFDSEDAWAERHGQPHRLTEALATLGRLRGTAGADDAMAALDDDGFERTQDMIISIPARIEQLAALPQTLLHHDLVRSNLFARDATTAAIDWENVGRGPFGVDLAPLVVGSVRRGEASAADLPVLEEVVVGAYEDGLLGCGLPADDVRLGYRLSLGLRWHVVLGTIHALLDPGLTRIRGSRPDEPRAVSLRHLTALSRHLLDSAAPGRPARRSQLVKG